jgi:hypothetical protein
MLMFPAMDASDTIRQRRPSHDRTSSVTFSMRQCVVKSSEPFDTRLVYLRDETPPIAMEGDALDATMKDVAHFVAAAANLVLTGHAVSGPDANDRFHDMRLALPADHTFSAKKKVLLP